LWPNAQIYSFSELMSLERQNEIEITRSNKGWRAVLRNFL